MVVAVHLNLKRRRPHYFNSPQRRRFTLPTRKQLERSKPAPSGAGVQGRPWKQETETEVNKPLFCILHYFILFTSFWIYSFPSFPRGDKALYIKGFNGNRPGNEPATDLETDALFLLAHAHLMRL